MAALTAGLRRFAGAPAASSVPVREPRRAGVWLRLMLLWLALVASLHAQDDPSDDVDLAPAPDAPAALQPVELPGRYRIAYEDAQLGLVSGVAEIRSDLAEVFVSLEHPKLGGQHRLVGGPVQREGNRVRIVLTGRSPEAERTSKPTPPNERLLLEVAPDAAQMVVQAPGAAARLPLAPRPRPEWDRVTLDLEIQPDGGLTGTWRYEADPVTQRDALGGGRTGTVATVEQDGRIATLQYGREAWLRSDPILAGVILLDEQVERVHPSVAPCEYPFSEDGRTGWVARTLFLYGINLPTEYAHACEVRSEDPALTYFIDELQVDAVRPGAAEGDLARGWRRLLASAKPEEADALRAMDALTLDVRMRRGVLPGPKRFTLNGASGDWVLQFGDNLADIRFTRAVTADEPGHSGSEDTTAVFIREVVQIEVRTDLHLPVESIPVFLGRNGTLVEFDTDTPWSALRVEGLPGVYRTPPFRLVAPGAPAASAGSGEPRLVEAAEGDTLHARLAAPDLLLVRRQNSDPSRGIARTSSPEQPTGYDARARVFTTPGRVGGLWRDAVRRAAICQNLPIEDWGALNDEQFNQYLDETTEKFVRTVIPVWNLIDRRPIRITVRDVAAMILLRDEFLVQMHELRQRIPAPTTPEGWRAFRRSMAPHMRDPNFPLALVEVDSPAGVPIEIPYAAVFTVAPATIPVARELGLADAAGNWRNATVRLGGTSVPYAFAFDEEYTSSWHQHYFGTDTAAARRWSEAALRQGLERYRASIDAAIARAEAAGDCDAEELLEITGVAFDPVRASLLPKLMTLAEGPGSSLTWVPDRHARAAVKGIETLSNYTQAVEALNSLENNLVLAAVGIVTLPLAFAESALAAAIMMGVDAADLAAGAVINGWEYHESQQEAAFALGSTDLLGNERAAEALEKRKSALGLALDIGLSAVGAGSGALDLMSALQRNRGLAALEQVRRGGVSAVDRLSAIEAADLAEVVRGIRAADTADLSDAMKRALELDNALRARGEDLLAAATRHASAQPPPAVPVGQPLSRPGLAGSMEALPPPPSPRPSTTTTADLPVARPTPAPEAPPRPAPDAPGSDIAATTPAPAPAPRPSPETLPTTRPTPDTPPAPPRPAPAPAPEPPRRTDTPTRPDTPRPETAPRPDTPAPTRDHAPAPTPQPEPPPRSPGPTRTEPTDTPERPPTRPTPAPEPETTPAPRPGPAPEPGDVRRPAPGPRAETQPSPPRTPAPAPRPETQPRSPEPPPPRDTPTRTTPPPRPEAPVPDGPTDPHAGRAASEISAWARNHDRSSFVAPDGMRLPRGEFIGQGGFARVHQFHGPDGPPSPVVKFFERRLDSHEEAFEMVRDTRSGARILRDAGMRQIDDIAYQPVAEIPYFVQRRIGYDLPEGVLEERRWEDIRRQVGTTRTGRPAYVLPEEHVDAFLDTCLDAIRNDLIIEDLRPENCAWQLIRDANARGGRRWTTAIHDKSRIGVLRDGQVSGNPGLAVFVDDMRYDPHGFGMPSQDPGGAALRDAREAMVLTLERYGGIRWDPATGRYVDGQLPAQRVRERLGDIDRYGHLRDPGAPPAPVPRSTDVLPPRYLPGGTDAPTPRYPRESLPEDMPTLRLPRADSVPLEEAWARMRPNRPAQLADIAHRDDVVALVRAEPEGVDRLLDDFGPDAVLDALRWDAYDSAAGLEQALRRARDRADVPRPGLYEGIAPARAPPGWSLRHDDVSEGDGILVLTTRLEGPGVEPGELGRATFSRSYDPSQGRLVFDSAINAGAQPWVRAPGPLELVPGRGIPTSAYVTLTQMRRWEIPPGSIREFRWSTVIHTPTALQLAWLRRQYPDTPLDELFRHTPSFGYNHTVITQSGHVVDSVSVSGGELVPVARFIAICGDTDEVRALVRRYDLQPDDLVPFGVDVTARTRPHPDLPRAGPAQPPPEGAVPRPDPPSPPGGIDPARVAPREPPLFVRAAGDPPNPVYLANAREAAAHFAAAWADPRAPLATAEGLRRALSDMHQIVAEGRAGRSMYRNDVEYPGRMRDALPEARLREKGFIRPQAEEYLARVQQDFPELQLSWRPGDEETVVPLRIDGVPEGAWPRNVGGGSHVYPSPGWLPAYLESAAAQLRSLGDLPDGSPEALEAILRYYHTVLNAAPFPQINNSILMIQLNALLRSKGLHDGVSHGWIDFLAYQLEFDDFRKIAALHLEGRLPPPAHYGINLR